MEGDKFYRGVFWVIDGALLAYPFIEGVYAEGTPDSALHTTTKSCGSSFTVPAASRTITILAAEWTRTTGDSR